MQRQIAAVSARDFVTLILGDIISPFVFHDRRVVRSNRTRVAMRGRKMFSGVLVNQIYRTLQKASTSNLKLFPRTMRAHRLRSPREDYGTEARMRATKGPGITPRKMMSAASADSEVRWKKSGE